MSKMEKMEKAISIMLPSLPKKHVKSLTSVDSGDDSKFAEHANLSFCLGAYSALVLEGMLSAEDAEEIESLLELESEDGENISGFLPSEQ